MPLLDYVLCASIYWVSFYLLFKLFIINKLKFKINRMYLLLTTIFAWVMPSIKWTVWANIPLGIESTLIQVYTHLSPTQILSDVGYATVLVPIYGVGVCIFLVRFLMNLAQIGQLIDRYPSQKQPEGFYEVRVPKLLEAFSFWNYLFIPESISYEEEEFNLIKTHEIQHIKQRHTLEVLILEVLMIGLWFHPMIYIYRHELKKNHEFSADFGVLKIYPNVGLYRRVLASNFLSKNNFLITNPFSEQKLIQCRLEMLIHYQETHALPRFWLHYIGVFVLIGIGSHSVLQKIIDQQAKLVFLSDAQRANFPLEFQGTKGFLVSEKDKTQSLKIALKAGGKYVFDLDHDSDLPQGTQVTLCDPYHVVVAENFGRYKSKFTYVCASTGIYTLRISFRHTQLENGVLRIALD